MADVQKVKTKPLSRQSFDDYANIGAADSGGKTDLTLGPEPCGFGRAVVLVAGAASSGLVLYDGTVATGTIIAMLDCTAINNETKVANVWCKKSLHGIFVDSGTTARVLVTYDVRG